MHGPFEGKVAKLMCVYLGSWSKSCRLALARKGSGSSLT